MKVKLTNLCVDIDAPIQLSAYSSGGSSVAEPSEEQVSMLSDMGFTPAQARKALRGTVSGLQAYVVHFGIEDTTHCRREMWNVR